jgi:hypothetical protein
VLAALGALLVLGACGGSGRSGDRRTADRSPPHHHTANAAPGGSPAAAAEPTVYVGVYLRDIASFELKDGLFTADFDVWLKWRGDFDPSRLSISNAGEVDESEPVEENDEEWHARRWRVRGRLRGEFPVHRFPFDEQRLAVTFELPVRAGRLEPDLAASGMSERFSVAGWHYRPEFRPVVAEQLHASDLGSLDGEGRATAVRRVAFTVTLERPLVTVGLKLFLPLFIIALVALVALFLHPEVIEPRSGIGVTALLSCFAFQFTVADTMPGVAYLTVADALFIIGYALTTLAMIESVLVHALFRNERVALALTLDRVSRVALPLATLVAVFAVVHRAPPEEARPIEPLVHIDRGAAAGTLRIASLTFGGFTTSDLLYGRRVVEQLTDEPPLSLVEQRPAVSNDALRLLAGGLLEVTWRLREGLKWSDGHPLGADDLRLAFETVPDDRVTELRTPDARTLVVVWKERVADALEPPVPLPAHRLRAVFARGGYEAVRKARREQVLPTIGPYRVVELVADERLVLERNPHYAFAPAAFGRVELRRYRDRAELLAALRAGDVDITVPNTVTPEDARALAIERPEHVQIGRSAALVVLHPDLSHPLLGRRAVRRALLAALDRREIAREVYGDEGVVAHVPRAGPPPAGTVEMPYDPVTARAALAEAGVSALVLRHGPADVDRLLAELIAGQLRAAGLHITTERVADVAERYRRRDHGGLLLHVLRAEREGVLRWWNLPIDGGRYVDGARHDAFDDEVASLADREMHALHPERRDQLRDRLLVAFSERLPLLPLVFASERVVADPALQRWRQPPDVPFFRSMERWTRR